MYNSKSLSFVVCRSIDTPSSISQEECDEHTDEEDREGGCAGDREIESVSDGDTRMDEWWLRPFTIDRTPSWTV